MITCLVTCGMKSLIHSQFNDCTMEVWEWINNFSTFYNGCDYLSLLELKLIHFIKGAPSLNVLTCQDPRYRSIIPTAITGHLLLICTLAAIIGQLVCVMCGGETLCSMAARYYKLTQLTCFSGSNPKCYVCIPCLHICSSHIWLANEMIFLGGKWMNYTNNDNDDNKVWSRYGVSFARILEKIYWIITASHYHCHYYRY